MSKNGKRRTTITDVAAKAGVSTGTVSAVLNSRDSVKASTRNRVLVAIEELGYRPTPSARILGSAQNNRNVFSKSAAILVKEMDNPFYAEVVLGALGYFEEMGYTPFICTSEGEFANENKLVDSLRERFIHGAIISPLLHSKADLSHLFMLKRHGFPFVLLEEVAGLPVVVVGINDLLAAQSAVEYLIQNGHKKIVHVAGPDYSQNKIARVFGVQSAFSESTLRFSDKVILNGGARMEDGYRACVNMLKTRPRDEWPTAITCFNDLVAIGVMRALAEFDLTVPDDVSVIGFDDIPTAEFLSVPLTTIHVPKREMGRRAAEILIKQIDDQEELPPHKVVFDAKLIVRASTSKIN